MLRVFLFCVAVTAGAVGVEPSWDRGARTLSLHVRDAAEIEVFLRRVGKGIAERAVAGVSADGPAPVGAGPPKSRRIEKQRAVSPEHTDADRRALNRLVDEKIRESEAD